MVRAAFLNLSSILLPALPCPHTLLSSGAQYIFISFFDSQNFPQSIKNSPFNPRPAHTTLQIIDTLTMLAYCVSMVTSQWTSVEGISPIERVDKLTKTATSLQPTIIPVMLTNLLQLPDQFSSSHIPS